MRLGVDNDGGGFWRAGVEGKGYAVRRDRNRKTKVDEGGIEVTGHLSWSYSDMVIES